MGAYVFNGTTTEVEGTLYFDISSLYNSTSVDQQIFYLTLTDSATGSALTVRSFEVADPANGNAYAEAANAPVAVDGSNTRFTIGSYTADMLAETTSLGWALSVAPPRVRMAGAAKEPSSRSSGVILSQRDND